jgi:hypothetical protein
MTLLLATTPCRGYLNDPKEERYLWTFAMRSDFSSSTFVILQ